MVQNRIGALVVTPDPFFFSRREKLVEPIVRYTMPAIYPSRIFADIGGLMSYGRSSQDLYARSGIYVGKILKGAKPADLRIQQSTKVELVINLRTAKALGLTVPPELLARADEVVESWVGDIAFGSERTQGGAIHFQFGERANLVDCSIGSSPDFAPRSILSTKSAARPNRIAGSGP